MAVVVPITLLGNTLGERHKYFNCLINEAFTMGQPFEQYHDSPEKSPIDRLFKISLASKHKDVKYITNTLKDKDMLYVSKALSKCLWLLEIPYINIVNPVYLNEVLYKTMTVTAVNKMQHWILTNLKDASRCEEFYMYYEGKNFNYAVGFLKYSSEYFLRNEIPKIICKLTPKQIKILSEKNTLIFTTFLNNFHNESILSKYLDNELKLYNSTKHLLRLNPDTYLDYIEKYYNKSLFQKLSANATQFIMQNHKQRFENKPELYTAFILNIKTLTKCLNNEEVKALLIKLARAKYLNSWFNYQNVECLVKAVDYKERAEFKKKIFVDESFGNNVEEWPYATPAPPTSMKYNTHIFRDKEYNPKDYAQSDNDYNFRRLCKKRKGGKYCEITSLDSIFDLYRFVSFEKAFLQLRNKLKMESELKVRQDILLVLVSKTGGRTESLEQLLRYLIERQTNEAMSLRATIARSLVKRANIWRVPDTIWHLYLQYTCDLGLNGKESDADCREGLHAVVLRDMLQGVKSSPLILKAFLNNVSYYTEYSLSSKEKRQVCKILPQLLLTAAAEIENDFERQVKILQEVLNVLEAYNVSAKDFPELVTAIISLTASSPATTVPLLKQAYKFHVDRSNLINEYFNILQTDQSYLNALRHNTNILKDGKYFQDLILYHKLHHDQFLQKLAIYFSEADGLAQKYLTLILSSKLHVKLARSLAILAGEKLTSIIKLLDSDPGYRYLAAQFRANGHLSKPPLRLVPWRKVGAKAISNQVLNCSLNEVDNLLLELLAWRRTCRLALIISTRLGKEAVTYANVSRRYPTVAIKSALSYFKNRGETADIQLVDIIRPLISGFDLNLNTRKKLRESIIYMTSICSAKIKSKIYPEVFYMLEKKAPDFKMCALCVIEGLLPDIDDDNAYNIVKDCCNVYFTTDKVTNISYKKLRNIHLSTRIIVKFMLLNKNVHIETQKLKEILEPLLIKMEVYWKDGMLTHSFLLDCMDQFLISLIYYKVYFDQTYVDCLPVFEYIENWIKKCLPVERFFEIHMRVNLTILYYKSIQECVKEEPDIFSDITKREIVGPKLVGAVMGVRIRKTISQLKYFESILVLYSNSIVNFLNRHFSYEDDKTTFIKFIIKGLVLESDVQSQLLAFFIFKEIITHTRNVVESDQVELREIFKKSNFDVIQILYKDFERTPLI